MNISQSILMLTPWTLWLIYWLIRAREVKPTVRRETVLSRAAQNITVGFGALCIVLPSLTSAAAYVFTWQLPSSLDAIGLVLTIAGLLLSVWGREYLGRNWSAAVELKWDHELVRSGPYALVRHPIYSGCLLALCGCALLGEQPRAAIGVVIVFAALIYKVRLEEHFMFVRFGAEYQHYRARVRALIPYVY